MASKSYFFSIAEAAAEQFVNEKTINIYKDLDFQDTKAGIRLNNLFLKITTHRIIFSNDPQIDKINPKSQSIFFKLMLKDIVKLEKKMKGLIHQKIDSFIIHIQNQQVEVFGKGLENPFLLLEGAIQKKEWAVEKTDQDQAKSEIYLGLKQEIKSNIMDAEKTKENVKSSFTNFDTFFKNFHELSEATKKLRQNQAQNQNDEVNRILESMGCIQVITKDEAGDKYYEELGKQIFKFCTELFPKQGGIVLLMDIYYYFNKKRQLSLLSPDEVLKACEQFKRLNLPANLTQYQGIKVVESTQFDIVKDFENTIGKLVSTQVGLTAEQISKKLGYSLMVTKIKLKRALENGLLCEDRRVEWTKYYRNIFLS